MAKKDAKCLKKDHSLSISSELKKKSTYPQFTSKLSLINVLQQFAMTLPKNCNTWVKDSSTSVCQKMVSTQQSQEKVKAVFIGPDIHKLSKGENFETQMEDIEKVECTSTDEICWPSITI